MTITSKPRLPLGARSRSSSEPDFDAALAQRRLPLLVRAQVTTLQVNLGKRCNHGLPPLPRGGRAEAHGVMRRRRGRARASTLARAQPGRDRRSTSPAARPSCTPDFRRVVDGARALGRHVIDRCNLTVLLEPGMEDTAGVPRRTAA